jgi:hydroxylamine reductase
MGMFCNQCQEAAKGKGCSVRGVCGISADVSGLRNLSVYVLEGISIYAVRAGELGVDLADANVFVMETLFETITNVNFSKDSYVETIKKGLKIREDLKEAIMANGGELAGEQPEVCLWTGETAADFEARAAVVGLKIAAPNEDVRSLREITLYGLKGLAAYTQHAYVLGYENHEIYAFMHKALAAMTDDTMSAEELTALALETGKFSVDAMALLDEANTKTYGHPELTEVNIGVGDKPGILISGHDLKDMEELLKQTEGTGVDVYTHSEMLPANYYPAFKKYDHFVGNYGNSWWKQDKEFESFNGPILMTTNCITPVKDSYKDRMFTTGLAGYPGVKHIPERENGNAKDFSAIVEMARGCQPPTEIETGKIVGGFAHNQVMALADKVVDAVKSGAIKRFVVMAGCDGRMKDREYFTDVAKALPKDAVILTAGCAKYRYNKLELGDIGGIPRVLDAGQCNDSYSLAVIALKLKEVFGLEDINDLPLSFDIGWYEQKAVCVLLALLHLGVKGIRLGPTLPAFVSPNVLNVLVENFNIKPTATVDEDVSAMMAGN